MYQTYFKKNKFGAVRTLANDGIKRDSKFEASIANELLIRKQAKDIVDYESLSKRELGLGRHQKSYWQYH